MPWDNWKCVTIPGVQPSYWKSRSVLIFTQDILAFFFPPIRSSRAYINRGWSKVILEAVAQLTMLMWLKGNIPHGEGRNKRKEGREEGKPSEAITLFLQTCQSELLSVTEIDLFVSIQEDGHKINYGILLQNSGPNIYFYCFRPRVIVYLSVHKLNTYSSELTPWLWLQQINILRHYRNHYRCGLIWNW